jgi:hypothetical protein
VCVGGLYPHTREDLTRWQVGFEYIANSSNALTYPLDELVVSRLPTQLRIHDAIIVATGLVFRDVLNEPTALITQDSRIVASGLIETVW